MKRSPMPAPRVPLARFVALKAGTPIRRVGLPVARAVPPALAATVRRVGARRRPRPDLIPRVTRVLVWQRAGGRCEVCGVGLPVTADIHHRRPRGQGGSRDPQRHSPANLLLVCGHGNVLLGCHPLIESNRAAAREAGWLVAMGLDPSEIPVRIHGRPGWTYLDADATYAAGVP